MLVSCKWIFDKLTKLPKPTKLTKRTYQEISFFCFSLSVTKVNWVYRLLEYSFIAAFLQ